ncbi:MAG: hypothetical protein J6I52_03525 [Prevotella sp.]|nr:hypothetical protein [Prevotella sp.]
MAMHYRLLVLILLQLCILTPSFAQGERIFQLDLKYNEFCLTKTDKGDFIIQSDRHDVVFKTDSLQPALPFVSVSILIAPNEVYRGFQLQGEDSLVQQNILIAPNPQPIPTYASVLDNKNKVSVSYNEKQYPVAVCEYQGTQLTDGYRTVTLLICPFTYDTTSGNLFFKQNLHIKLATTKSSICDKSFTGTNMREMISRRIINSEELATLYPLSSSLRHVQSNATAQYEYLIITNNALKPTFEELSSWKTFKGVRSKVITVEEIYSAYTGADLQEKIKCALLDYYDGTYHGLTYVLLGGDVNIVPARMCYIECGNRVDTTPADIYYACLNGDITWDGDGDGIFGEVEDDVDLSPELYVTRIPVRNQSDARSFVRRIISYERFPKKDSWHNTILMGGCKIKANVFFDGDSISDSQYKSEKCYRNYIAPYWNGTRVRFYDTATDFPGGSDYQFNATNIQEQLSKGYNFVNISTHGNNSMWVTEEGLSYYMSSAASLHNQGYSFIFTIACNTNSFDKFDPCLSEAFMRNSQGGIVGYVGCSREGWYLNEFQSGASEIINEDIYALLFSSSKKNFGKIVQDAKVSSCSFDLSYGTFRWLLLGVNPLGDPETPVFDVTPQSFGDIDVSILNGSVTIKSHLSGCRFCVSDENDEDYYIVQNGNEISVRNDRETYKICITKPGYIPCTVIIGYNQYLQNQTIEGDVRLFSTNVAIGENVTNLTTPSPVYIVNGGNLVISKKGEALLDKGFSLEQGGTLEIKKW